MRFLAAAGMGAVALAMGGELRAAEREMAPEVLATEVARLKDDEGADGVEPRVQRLEQLLERSGKGRPVVMSDLLVAMLFGDRRGGPDPWRDIGPTEIGGQKVKAVGLYVNLAPMDEAGLAEAELRQVHALLLGPGWRKKVLQMHLARTGVLAVVAPEDLAALEHAIYLIDVRGPAKGWWAERRLLDESEPEVLYQLYFAGKVREEKPLAVGALLEKAVAYEGKRVTLAAYFIDHFEGPWLYGDGNRLETSVGLQDEWSVRFLGRHGRAGRLWDLRVEEVKDWSRIDEAYRFYDERWTMRKPVMATGVFRRLRTYRGMDKTNDPVPVLEGVTVREVEEGDGAWQAAQKGGKKKER